MSGGFDCCFCRNARSMNVWYLRSRDNQKDACGMPLVAWSNFPMRLRRFWKVVRRLDNI